MSSAKRRVIKHTTTSYLAPMYSLSVHPLTA